VQAARLIVVYLLAMNNIVLSGKLAWPADEQNVYKL
jgi:hypothetical protein